MDWTHIIYEMKQLLCLPFIVPANHTERNGAWRVCSMFRKSGMLLEGWIDRVPLITSVITSRLQNPMAETKTFSIKIQHYCTCVCVEQK